MFSSLGDFSPAHTPYASSISQRAPKPVLSPDKNVVVVFTVRFSTSGDRVELEGEGFRFRTQCDTEVVLHAFQRWGSACFSRFRGMFAIAVWRSPSSANSSPGPHGHKPLVLLPAGWRIYFGSELKCIFAHPAFREDLPPGIELLSQPQLRGPAVHSGRGHREADAGQVLEWQNVMQRPPQRSRPFTGASVFADEACQELDRLLRSRLVSNSLQTCLGHLLSGGLDSSTVLHYAARTYPGRCELSL